MMYRTYSVVAKYTGTVFTGREGDHCPRLTPNTHKIMLAGNPSASIEERDSLEPNLKGSSGGTGMRKDCSGKDRNDFALSRQALVFDVGSIGNDNRFGQVDLGTSTNKTNGLLIQTLRISQCLQEFCFILNTGERRRFCRNFRWSLRGIIRRCWCRWIHTFVVILVRLLTVSAFHTPLAA